MQTLAGTVEKIIYTNEENHYTVAQFLVEGEISSITIIGNLVTINVGETLKVTGEWKTHSKFGRQFKVNEFKSITPNTVTGIKKYLGSGLIKGIGPKTAEKIVDYYKKDTLKIIDDDPEKLKCVPGIGKVTIDRIAQAWVEQREIREVMVFLQSYEISSAYAVKIYKKYGREAVNVVRENPYKLSTDIFGIGFKIADRIAANLGIPKNSILRAKAAVFFILREFSSKGHVYANERQIYEYAFNELEIDKDLIKNALTELQKENEIVVDNFNSDKQIYITRFYKAEDYCAKRLSRLIANKSLDLEIGIDNEINAVQSALNIKLSQGQKKAIEKAIHEKILVITGGPGTGKTTIINSIIYLIKKKNVKIQLCAPTGRAAKRMSEATGEEAKTIHRLLEYNPHKRKFEKNFENPVLADLLVVDEFSMIDIQLFASLLDAIRDKTSLIFIGDVDQLPSVGAGNVLKDLIASELIPVVQLTEIFRQAEKSKIIVNSHRVNKGFMPFIDNAHGTDFFFIETNDQKEAADIIVEIYKNRIPAKFGFNPFTDIQVLTPMNKGVAGVNNLNAVLQGALNNSTDELVRGSKMFKTGDKVMQIRNNYDKNVFNGDMGVIERIDGLDQKVFIDFGGRVFDYDFSLIDELTLAYAVSIHKSQGSEYPCVIIPILTAHYVMLQRNLIYTAITRGKKMVNIVGSRKALEIAVSNDKIAGRNTLLAQRLKQRVNG